MAREPWCFHDSRLKLASQVPLLEPSCILWLPGPQKPHLDRRCFAQVGPRYSAPRHVVMPSMATQLNRLHEETTHWGTTKCLPLKNHHNLLGFLLDCAGSGWWNRRFDFAVQAKHLFCYTTSREDFLVHHSNIKMIHVNWQKHQSLPSFPHMHIVRLTSDIIYWVSGCIFIEGCRAGARILLRCWYP